MDGAGLGGFCDKEYIIDCCEDGEDEHGFTASPKIKFVSSCFWQLGTGTTNGFSLFRELLYS